MAWAKGPQEGYGAWAKEEVRRAFPDAVCKRVEGDGVLRGVRGYAVLIPSIRPEPVVVKASAREAWAAAHAWLDRRAQREDNANG